MKRAALAITVSGAIGLGLAALAWWTLHDRARVPNWPGASLSSEHRAALARIEDPGHRDFYARLYAVGSRSLTADELEYFLRVLEAADKAVTEADMLADSASRQASRVTAALHLLADRWIKGGPFAPGPDERAIACAADFESHPDPVLRSGAALLLFAAKENPPPGGLSPTALGALERLIKHPYVASSVTRFYEAWGG